MVWGTSNRLTHELKRFGGMSLPNIRGQVSETCPALSPAVMPPYEIWMMSRMNDPRAILEGSDHFAFLPFSGKPYLCPNAVQRLNPSSDNASSRWIVRLKWLTEGRSTSPLATMIQPANAWAMKS